MASQPLAFISYSTADAHRAAALAVALRQRGIEVWIDIEQIRPGDPILSRISLGLEAADAVLILTSKNSLESPWCRREYEVLLSREIVSGTTRVIPVRLDASGVPAILEGKAAVDLRDGIDERSAQELASAIRVIRAARAAGTTPGAARPGDEPIRGPFLAPTLPMQYVPRPSVLDALRAQVLAPGPDERGVLVVTAVHGLGGVGKSTMAAAICHAESVQAQFTDGILWATLGENPDILVLQTGWIRALGDHEFRPTTPADAASRLRLLLAGKAVLLVVDDVWNDEHARFFLVGGSASRTVLTTRRAHIADLLDAALCPLGEMKPEEALALVEKWLRRPLGPGEAGQARAFAAAVGYHPLALKLVAAGVARGMDWETVNQALARQPGGPGGGDESLMAMTQVDASLRVSLRQLRREHESRWRHFARLGLLARGASFEPGIAAALWGMSAGGAAVVLENLAADAFLGRQGKTFVLHDLMHDLALRTLTGTEPEGLGVSSASAHRALVERLREECDGEWEEFAGDVYVHRFLSWHIEQGGDARTMQQLLRRSTSDGANAWFHAKQQRGDIPGFQADVQRALRLAQRSDHLSLVGQAWYALMLSTLRSKARQLTSVLIRTAVERNVWSVAQGLALARDLMGDRVRANALLAVLKVARQRGGEPAELLHQGTFDALAALRKARDADGLADLVGLSYGPLRDEVMRQLRSVLDEAPLSWSARVIDRLPAECRRSLVDAVLSRLVQESADPLESAETMVGLLVHLDDEELRGLLPSLLEWLKAAATSVVERREHVYDISGFWREEAAEFGVEPLIPPRTEVEEDERAPPLLLPVRASDAGHNRWDDPRNRRSGEDPADAKSVDSRDLLPEPRNRAERFRDIKRLLTRLLMDRNLVRRLGDDAARRLEAFSDPRPALTESDADEDKFKVPEHPTPDDIATILAGDNPSTMMPKLVALLPHLSESGRSVAQDRILEFLEKSPRWEQYYSSTVNYVRWNPGRRTWMLVALAESLPAEEVGRLASRWFDVPTSAWGMAVSEEMLQLLPLLPSEEQEPAIERMLHRLEQTKEPAWRQRSAEMLAQALPAKHLHRVLEGHQIEDHAARARFLITVAPYLPGGLPADAADALAGSVGNDAEGRNVRTIISMVRRLSAALNAEQLSGFVQEARNLVSEWWITEAVNVLARSLTDPVDLHAVFDAMQELRNLDLRARAKNYVVERLAALGRADAALAAAQHVDLAPDRWRGLGEIAVRVAERGDFTTALRTVKEISDRLERSRAQAFVALHMAQWGKVARAHKLANSVASPEWRAWARDHLASVGGENWRRDAAVTAPAAPTTQGFPNVHRPAIRAALKERSAREPGARWWERLEAALPLAGSGMWDSVEAVLLEGDVSGTSFFEHLSAQERPQLLEDLALIASVAGTCGREDEIRGFCSAVNDVCGWWP